jgi:hypothetical protein
MNSDLIDHVQPSTSTTLHRKPYNLNTVLPDLLYTCRYAGLSSERLRPDILSSCSSHNYDKLQTGPPGYRSNSTAGVAGPGRSHGHARWDLVEFTGIRTAGSVSLHLAAGAFGRGETARDQETENHRI